MSKKKSAPKRSPRAPQQILVADLRCDPEAAPLDLRACSPGDDKTPHLLAAFERDGSLPLEPEHSIHDLGCAVPHLMLPKGYLDLLLVDPAPPTPTSNGPRNHPWYVLQWCTQVRVRTLLVDASPALRQWGSPAPQGETDQPGAFFQSWLNGLRDIGFRFEYRDDVPLARRDGRLERRLVLIGRSDRRRMKLTWPTNASPEAGLTPFVHQVFAA